MDNLKDKIIDRIINILVSLRSTYPNDINTITNDLINYKYDSLIEFVNHHFKNLNVSNEIKEFINQLINAKLIDESFKDKIKTKKIYELIPFIENNILLIDSKPLNVKEKTLNKIQDNTPIPKIIQINHEYAKIDFPEPIIDDIDTLQSENQNNTQESHINIDDLRKKILDAQLNYINDATNFIKNLETMDEIELYQSLIDLNDIRFIQHSLSKLSHNTLYRLLPYVETKLENNKHSSIDMFIIDVINKYLHTKMH